MFLLFHTSPKKLCFQLENQRWTSPFLKTHLYISHKEQVMCCFTAACLLICDLFCLWMGLSWWFIEKEPKTMLSKLFTQSHQAEKFKLRLISGFNQNKLYYSFNWTVKPFRVCSICWTCRTQDHSPYRNYETVNIVVNLWRLPFFAELHSAFTWARISARLLSPSLPVL